MAERSDYPKVLVKRKNIQTVVDYCLDEGIEFNVKQQAFSDDYEIEMKIFEIKQAILAGMFLRENRIDLVGMEAQRTKKVNTPRKPKSDDNGTPVDADKESAEENTASLGF